MWLGDDQFPRMNRYCIQYTWAFNSDPYLQAGLPINVNLRCGGGPVTWGLARSRMHACPCSQCTLANQTALFETIGHWRIVAEAVAKSQEWWSRLYPCISPSSGSRRSSEERDTRWLRTTGLVMNHRLIATSLSLTCNTCSWGYIWAESLGTPRCVVSVHHSVASRKTRGVGSATSGSQRAWSCCRASLYTIQLVSLCSSRDSMAVYMA